MNKRRVTALIGISSLLALGALTGCGPKPDEADTTTTTAPSTDTMTASPGTMMASPGTMMASPGTMATTAPPPGPK